jgi:hypothetical protein
MVETGGYLMYLTAGLGASTSPADLISSLAPSYGVPPSLAQAVAQKESGLNPNAVGSAGEIGLFQVKPSTAAQFGFSASDLYDPTSNAQAGLSYLQQLYNQFGNWTDALEAYNGGPSHVTAGTVSSAAKSYAQSIMDSIGSLFSSSPAVPTLEAATFPSFGLDLTTPEGGLSGTAWIALGLGFLGLAVWAVNT